MRGVTACIHSSTIQASHPNIHTSMSTPETDLFDVYDFDAEVKRLRQERQNNPRTGVRNPFSLTNTTSTQSDDDMEEEEDEDGRRDVEDEKDAKATELSDQDLLTKI